MIGRRAILKAATALLATPATAAVSGVSISQAAGLLGVPRDGLDPVDECGQEVAGTPNKAWDAINAINRRRNEQTLNDHTVPFHIATKKSWSPAFKAHVLNRENDIQAALEKKMHDDEDFMRALLGGVL
jgi:hypothetical protein